MGAADRAARQTACERLGEADDVGRDTEQAGRPAGVHAEAGLDLVERQQHAVAAGELANTFEVPGVGRDDAGVHHHRLHDHAGDRALVVVQHTLERLEIVERHEVHEIGHRLRDAGGGNAMRVVGRAEHVEVAPLRDHHRVVVAVIRALDLDDRRRGR